MNRNQLIEELTKIVGADSVLHQPDEVLVYEYDASFDTHTPDVVVLPRTSQQVSQIVKLAAQHNLPLVARGAGTGLSGGAVPLQGGILIVLTRMTDIKSLDVRNRRAVVEAGVINLDLVTAAGKQGYTYAPDPGSGKVATIGGNINSNAGGPHCLAYGVTANHVVGLQLVLPNGEIIETGSPLTDSIGYDLTGVLVGSEGTLGIVTEATTQLMSQAEAVRTVLVVFETNIKDASEAVSDIIAQGIVPTAMEMMDGMVCRAVEEAVHAGYPENAAGVLLIEVEGVVDGLDDTMAKIEEICRHHNAAEVHHATTETERAALWTGRKSALGAMGRIAPNYYLEDAVVPRHKLPDVMALVNQTAKKYNLPIGNFFHAGDGNIHPTILFDRRDPDASGRARKAADEIMVACINAGGTASGEHGIGTEKQDYMASLYNQDDLDAMADLKACFNPDGRLNPGKIFPKTYQPSVINQQTTPGNNKSKIVTHQSKIINHLESVVGAANILVDETAGDTVLVKPGSVAEVSALLHYANEAGLSVSPQGGQTKRLLGNASKSDLVVSTERLTEIIEHYPSDLTAAFQAGITLAEANKALSKTKQMLPLDAPLSGQATLGGIVAAGPLAAGLRRTAYGTVRDMLLGVQFVRPDGRVVRRGGMVVKNVAGYDLSRLQYGAMGTLGLITQVNLKLSPQPEDSGALLAGFNSRQQAGQVIDQLLASQLQPATVTLFDDSLANAMDLTGPSYWLLARFDGRTAAVTRQITDTKSWSRAAKALEIVTWDQTTLTQHWPSLTDFAQLADRTPNEALLRLNVPSAQVINSLSQLETLCTKNDLSPVTLTDAANGIIWLRVSQPGEQLAASLSKLVPRLQQQWPQTVLAAALPELKQNLNVWGPSPNALGLMQTIRQKFDPQGMLNRGRYLV